MGKRTKGYDDIKAGSVVEFRVSDDVVTGRVVMRSSHGGWVVNIGGTYGTPKLCDQSNFIKLVRL